MTYIMSDTYFGATKARYGVVSILNPKIAEVSNQRESSISRIKKTFTNKGKNLSNNRERCHEIQEEAKKRMGQYKWMQMIPVKIEMLY